MDVSALKARIKSKQIPSYLIFSGDEWKVQQIYINQIAKVTGKEIVAIDSVSALYGQLKNRSFVQKTRIYKVRDDSDLMQNEKLQQQIANGLLGDNILIHLLTSVDKRTKFYKANKDSIIEFAPLSDGVLTKYVKKEINLSNENCLKLIDLCEHSYGRILLEIDKIRWYEFAAELEGYDMEHDSAFQDLVNDGTIYEPPYDAIFDFVDKVLDRKVNAAFNLMGQAYAVGEATMVMLSVLYTNAKAVLQVQSCGGDNISKSTGLTGWQIKNAKSHVGKYKNQELVNMLRLIQKIESGIKTGRIEDEFAMAYLLTHIM